MPELPKSIEDYQYIFQGYTKSLQGVVRLTDEIGLATFFQKQPDVKSYILSTEKNNTKDGTHVHYLIQGTEKTLNIFNIRKRVKAYWPDVDWTTQGVFNISKCKNPLRLATYIQKEALTFTIHGYPKQIRELKQFSFKKEISMTTAIQKLKDEYIYQRFEVQEYMVQYRMLRIKYRKPDPNWVKEMYKMQEQIKTETQIREEVNEAYGNHRCF